MTPRAERTTTVSAATTRTTPSRTPADAAGGRMARFDRVERAVHWTNGLLFLVLLGTGFTLYGAPGTGWVGNRLSIKEIHTWVGYAMPIPILLGIATHAGKQLRSDLHRFSRWTADDRRWWRRSTKPQARIGKFNPGQKLNAAFIGACIIVMPVTGTFLRFPTVFALHWRSGADFTHRWFAFALLLVTFGHILIALSRPASLRGMVTGRVPRAWARHEHPRWYAEVTALETIDAADSGPTNETGSAWVEVSP